MVDPKVYVRSRYNAGVSLHNSHVTNMKGHLAVKLADHFGVICGAPDGEDSAGRAKLRLMTPAEVVSRACDIANLLVDALGDRGWLAEVPEPKADEEADKDA